MTSDYDQYAKDLLQDMQDQGSFEYNAADDDLYNSYVDRYIQNAAQSKADTARYGAGLTGGYGNHYVTDVAQQQEDEYLQGLNDNLANIYQRAQTRYNDQFTNQYNLWNAAQTEADKMYDRYVAEQNVALSKASAAKSKSSGGSGGGGSSKKSTASSWGFVDVAGVVGNMISDGATADVSKYLQQEVAAGSITSDEASYIKHDARVDAAMSNYNPSVAAKK